MIFFLNLFILIGGYYNIVVVFTIHWHESAMGVHVSPILNPFSSPSQSHPSGSSQCTGFECCVSCIELGLVIYLTYGNIHVSMLFSQITQPSPYPTESNILFLISVSLLLSHIKGHHYHLSKFHIYVLIYCIGFSFWFTSHCIIGSSFIHLIRTDSNPSFLIAE